jgi:transposase-like protein
MPVFSHAENDIKSFRMITSQFCVNGNAKQADIARAFGITKIIVKRSVKLYREKGIQGFYAPRNVRGATILTEDVLLNVQGELNKNIPLATIANQHNIKLNTLQKAIKAGCLHHGEKKTSAQS